MNTHVQADFVVAAPRVLHERVTADDHAGGTLALESTQWSESGFAPAAVTPDASSSGPGPTGGP